MSQFLTKHQMPHIGHSLGLQYTVQMITFMLHYAGMETFRFPVDLRAVRRQGRVADTLPARLHSKCSKC